MGTLGRRCTVVSAEGLWHRGGDIPLVVIVKGCKTELLEELVSGAKALGIQDYQMNMAVPDAVCTAAAESVGVHAASAVVDD